LKLSLLLLLPAVLSAPPRQVQFSVKGYDVTTRAMEIQASGPVIFSVFAEHGGIPKILGAKHLSCVPASIDLDTKSGQPVHELILDCGKETFVLQSVTFGR
jgi:hypothetical protein